jgi:hypothetical protein
MHSFSEEIILDIADNLIRRAAHSIGWEIGSAIENVIWTVGIGIFLFACAACSCGAVAWKLM